MQQTKRTTVIASLGTLLEWAEFTFYAYMASKIAALFFPEYAPSTGIIATFAVFAIGYFMRPLGAVLFGHIGDRYGRRLALQWSISIMGLASLLMGLLPTYDQAGLAAPLLLLLLRCLQGLAVSGEFNGSAIFLIEHASKRLHLAGSWTGWAAALGMMIGSVIATIVSLPHMPNWSWRLPFILGAGICLIGLYLRRQTTETPAFLALSAQQKKSRWPIKKVFQQHPYAFVLAVAISATVGIYVYIGNLYYVSFLTQTTTLAAYQTKLVAAFGEALVVLFFPLAAIAADRYGGKKIMAWGFFAFLWIGPILYFMPKTNTLGWIAAGQVLYALGDAMAFAPIFKYLNDLFPTDVRYSAVSFAWSISTALFAGTSPMIAQMLRGALHWQQAPLLYIVMAGVVGLLVLRLRTFMQI